MCFASSTIQLTTLSVLVPVSLVYGFGTCPLSWPPGNRRHIHTPVDPPRRPWPPVIQSLRLLLLVARHLASRPSPVVHLVALLLFFVRSLATPLWDPSLRRCE